MARHKSEIFSAGDYLHPRFWPMWLFIAFLRLLALLPYAWLLRTGRLIGRTLQLLSRKRNRVAEINLQLCFPDKSDEQRQQIADLGYRVADARGRLGVDHGHHDVWTSDSRQMNVFLLRLDYKNEGPVIRRLVRRLLEGDVRPDELWTFWAALGGGGANTAGTAGCPAFTSRRANKVWPVGLLPGDKTQPVARVQS